MFTGIVSDIGTVTSRIEKGDTTFVMACAYDAPTIDLGASIACSGVCLTVTDRGVRAGQNWFSVDVSEETMMCTTARGWQPGACLNLERALRMGDELGGHLVLGHVDGLARIADIRKQGDSLRFTFELPAPLSRFITPKGSVVLNGVSLTVNEVENNFFGVNIIPHTAQATTFGSLQPGHEVNLEVDMLARYVARLLDKKD